MFYHTCETRDEHGLHTQAFECSMEKNHGSGARTAGSPVDTSLDSVGFSSGAQALSFPLFFGFGFLR